MPANCPWRAFVTLFASVKQIGALDETASNESTNETSLNESANEAVSESTNEAVYETSLIKHKAVK